MSSLIITGAGVAGLSAGIYARKNGFDCTVFEMHDRPGGVCTGWRRRGYTVDGCIHWVMGTHPKSPLRRLWDELHALDDLPIVDLDEFQTHEGPDGRQLHLYSDLDRFVDHLRELSPGDGPAIDRLARDVRRFRKMEVPISPSVGEALRIAWAYLGLFPAYQTLGALPIRTYAERFQDPLIREGLHETWGEAPNFPAAAVLTTLASLSRHDAGFPVGGSLAFAGNLARAYQSLGGALHLGQRVETILVEGGRAVGVRLQDGTEHRADYVVSAADAHATLFGMLGGRYVPPLFQQAFDGALPLFPGIVLVSLGLARDLSSAPFACTFPIPEPIQVLDRTHHRLFYRHLAYDPTTAPAGHTVLMVNFSADFGAWAKLAEDPAAYRAEKERVADQVVAALDRRFPGLASQVEVRDVATPVSWVRYTNNWRGSYEGWLVNTENFPRIVRGWSLPKVLPGLDRFHLIGQWTNVGGGLPTSALDGRNLVKRLCKAEGRKFRTADP